MFLSRSFRLRRSSRRVLVSSVLLLATALAQAASWKVLLLEEQNPAALDRSRLERAYLGHPGGPGADGWSLALEDGRFELEAARTQIHWTAQDVSSLESARAAAQQAEKAGHQAIVLNLPASWAAAVSKAVKLPLINVGAGADSLREAQCQRNLLHTLPSDRMRADALAQALVSRKWLQVLLLAGPSEQDRLNAASAQASLRRYGLALVAQRPFRMSADPRDRDLANPRLLTSGLAYDVVWVVDADGEFARALSYNIQSPRPVVGDAGMVAMAWHAQYERFGAPQVSRRFAKSYKRAMTQQDWASWMAGKAMSAAAISLNKATAPELLLALNKQSLDGSKGVVMQFRPWDGQLQQTMLLTDGQGVIGTAPVEGVLHPRNVLDTLGADSTEKRCPNRP